MAMRSLVSSTALRRLMDRSAAFGTGLRYFSDGSGRVLGEEERAAENVYIKKMEKEKLEKQKAKAEKEKEKAEKEKADKKAAS